MVVTGGALTGTGVNGNIVLRSVRLQQQGAQAAKTTSTKAANKTLIMTAPFSPAPVPQAPLVQRDRTSGPLAGCRGACSRSPRLKFDFKQCW